MTAVIASNMMCGSLTSGKTIPVSFVSEQSKANVQTISSDFNLTFETPGMTSFLEALSDYKSERIIDLDKALTDPPPEV